MTACGEEPFCAETGVAANSSIAVTRGTNRSILMHEIFKYRLDYCFASCDMDFPTA